MLPVNPAVTFSVLMATYNPKPEHLDVQDFATR